MLKELAHNGHFFVKCENCVHLRQVSEQMGMGGNTETFLQPRGEESRAVVEAVIIKKNES